MDTAKTRSIDADLRRAARAFLNSEGLNRNELAVFVREALDSGMSLSEIGDLTGVSADELAALSR